MAYARSAVPVDARRPVHHIWTVSARLDGDTFRARQEVERHWPNHKRSDVLRSPILTLHQALGLSDGDRP